MAAIATRSTSEDHGRMFCCKVKCERQVDEDKLAVTSSPFSTICLAPFSTSSEQSQAHPPSYISATSNIQNMTALNCVFRDPNQSQLYHTNLP